MTQAAQLTSQYDTAAGTWRDKMRALGYADAYLGFLTNTHIRAAASDRVCDVGCGTGAFAEGWVAIYGAESDVTLLDPSAQMLSRAQSALHRRGAVARSVAVGLQDFEPEQPFDQLLIAHVLEHVPDPTATLSQLRRWVGPGARLWLVASKPHWCNAIIWLQWRHRTFKDAEMGAMLTSAGWRLDQTYAFPSGPPSRTSRGYLATAI